MLQGIRGVEAGTKKMGEGRGEDDFKESSRLPYLKAQLSLNPALTSILDSALTLPLTPNYILDSSPILK